ncbi:DUF6714 family protein [Aquimarina hainanensis]|uniref:DUF6714 family protein n=1 Tax=Aquimarina hainanensis TaxID=1578017 RepID=A0ABW5NAL8_9FLAO|nr:DUF6714 family protein [Aquimarina sp. TRL1]QKX04061.1 hypothetical protein HN014_03780 [Aquimarina sp. TRL1]
MKKRIAEVLKMNKKEKLIQEIQEAFKGVKLDDGIGLWEAQGHDDRGSEVTCKKLRTKDETNDWTKISLIDMYTCSSAISFFDAKGMCFHMPKYLLLALGAYKNEEQKLIDQGLIEEFYKPDIEDRLTTITRYLSDKSNSQDKEFYRQYFSLFTKKQLLCVVRFLEYRKDEIGEYYTSDEAKALGISATAVNYDKEYLQLQKAIDYWSNNFLIQ